MIYASGIVTVLSNNFNHHSLKLKNKNITLEAIEPRVKAEERHSSQKVRCKFTAILPTSYECRSLEDYTGKVKPFLQASIKSVISSVEISHLNYVSTDAIRSFKNKN